MTESLLPPAEERDITTMMESLCEMADTRYSRYIAQTMPQGSGRDRP